MAAAQLFIKHVSEHFYKLGHIRQFFDTEHLFTEQEITVLHDLQKKYGKMGELLAKMYEFRNAGVTNPTVFWEAFPELRSWLDEAVFDAKQSGEVTDPVLSKESGSPQKDPSSTNPEE